MVIKNNTHYYSIANKTYNIIPDSDSWQFESSKRLSYSQRLYWEYKYVKSVGGQAFFYTFTYNNDNLPYFEYDMEVFDDVSKKYVTKHFKTACFNYNHIRLLTNGIISKTLRRKYGSQLRYFVACERGEGKGLHRKKGQNSHYHVIFFISPLPDNVRKPKDVPYKRISPIQFCHLCKCVWQYNSSPNKYDHLVADYKSARFGHCQPGNDVGLITDFDALSYVSKYVCKDSTQIFDDSNIRQYYIQYFKKLGYTYHSLYSFYYYLHQDGCIIDRNHFLSYSGLDKFFWWRSVTGRRDISWYRYLSLHYSVDFDSFLKDFDSYFNSIYLPAISDKYYRDYCNLYGSKPRCSKSLGIYGLSFVNDIDKNPHFTIDKSDEVVNQPICLYYYRKLYFNVVRCPQTGNPLYVLNDVGLNLKCLSLRSSLDKLRSQVFDAVHYIQHNCTVPSFLSFVQSKALLYSSLNNLLVRSDFNDIVDRFCVYRFVYQFRHYSKFDLDHQPFISSAYTFDNIVADYRYFLQSNFYSCDYNSLNLYTLIECSPFYNVVSFSCHPSFSSFIEYFDVLEGFFSVYQEYISDIKKKKFADSLELRKVLISNKYSVVNSI